MAEPDSADDATARSPQEAAGDAGARDTAIADAGNAPARDQINKLAKIKLGIAVVIFVSFPVLLISLLYALYFLFDVIGEKQPNSDALTTAEKMALAASVQVAVGMVMGFVSVFIGLMMTWFGINAAFEFTGKAGEKGEATLKSASPGLLFFLGGTILIGVSLYKRIEYQEPGHVTPIRTEGAQREKVHGVIPDPLPPMNQTDKQDES